MIAGACALRDDVSHDVAMYVGEAEGAALVAIGKALVVDAEKVQDGGLEVMDVDLVFDDVCVKNLDGLFEQMRARLDQLPEGRGRIPFDQPYGQREFHVIDEDSLLIFFGEPAGS